MSLDPELPEATAETGIGPTPGEALAARLTREAAFHFAQGPDNDTAAPMHHPYVEIGGVRVFVHLDAVDGLVVALHLDTADPALLVDSTYDDTRFLPVRILFPATEVRTDSAGRLFARARDSAVEA